MTKMNCFLVRFSVCALFCTVLATRPSCTPLMLVVNATDNVAPVGNLAINLSLYCNDMDNDTLYYEFYNDTDGYLANIFDLDITGELIWKNIPDAEAFYFLPDTDYRGPFVLPTTMAEIGAAYTNSVFPVDVIKVLHIT